jgi:hypothetical protein
MIDVFTCLWGTKYNRSFVESIKDKIAKYLTLPHKFHCVTDKPVKEYDLPIKHSVLKGMFIKMSLFEYTGKCLYFDIDAEINENIDFLADDFTGLTLLDSTKWKEKQSDLKFKLNNNTFINTSIMRWSDQRQIFKKFMLKRDMYLRIYQATDRFIYNEGFDHKCFNMDKISSWQEQVDYNSIMLYNGKYNNELQPRHN